jgi:hypothetical protein
VLHNQHIAFKQAGVRDEILKNKNFKMKRKHFDKTLQRHNHQDRRHIAGMLNFGVMSCTEPTNNAIHRQRQLTNTRNNAMHRHDGM